LLGATAVPTEIVPVPELGGDVLVRGMTARQRTEFEKKFVTEKRGRQTRNLDDFREQLLVFCCVDPALTQEDVSQLSKVRADIIERIATVAAQLASQRRTSTNWESLRRAQQLRVLHLQSRSRARPLPRRDVGLDGLSGIDDVASVFPRAREAE